MKQLRRLLMTLLAFIFVCMSACAAFVPGTNYVSPSEASSAAASGTGTASSASSGAAAYTGTLKSVVMSMRISWSDDTNPGFEAKSYYFSDSGLSAVSSREVHVVTDGTYSYHVSASDDSMSQWYNTWCEGRDVALELPSWVTYFIVSTRADDSSVKVYCKVPEDAAVDPGVSPVTGAGTYDTVTNGMYLSITDYGAVGNAAYQAHMGHMIPGSVRFLVGFYSSEPVYRTYYRTYYGSINVGLQVELWQVVADDAACGYHQIRRCDAVDVDGSLTAVGAYCFAYTAVDNSASVPAADSTAAIEAAIEAGDGTLYLPEGDYVVSMSAAGRIRDISGPGRLWLKEWLGGTTYHLGLGYSYSKTVAYSSFGWTDAAHFHDQLWDAMHWGRAYLEQADASNTWSSSVEEPFDGTRSYIRTWATITSNVPLSEYPDYITVCVSKNTRTYYTADGSTEWKVAAYGIGGNVFSMNWDGTSHDIAEEDIVDCGDHFEFILRRSYLQSRDGVTFCLHLWNANTDDLSGVNVSAILSYGVIWIKEAAYSGYLRCDLGCDLYTKDSASGIDYAHQAYEGMPKPITGEKQAFFAYSIDDSSYDTLIAAFRARYLS